MPYSLYIDSDSDSARCIFHPLWHCQSSQCCRDVVAIELLWIRDSLIVRMGGLVVKSIQCSWLRKSPTCWRHVAPTAKCRHIWPKCPCRGDTILIPTHFFVSGFADIHQIFLFSTIGTYVEFLCKIWLKYLFDIRSPCTFLLLSTPKFKIFAVTRALPT